MALLLLALPYQLRNRNLGHLAELESEPGIAPLSGFEVSILYHTAFSPVTTHINLRTRRPAMPFFFVHHLFSILSQTCIWSSEPPSQSVDFKCFWYQIFILVFIIKTAQVKPYNRKKLGLFEISYYKYPHLEAAVRYRKYLPF